GQLRGEAAHGLADDAVDAAADEQGAALDVDPADGVAEQHHRQDEPRRRRPDGLLDDAADVEGGAAQVAEYDGGGAPVGDEGEGDAADDDDLGGPRQAAPAGRAGALGSRHGVVSRKVPGVGTASVQETGGPFSSAR